MRRDKVSLYVDINTYWDIKNSPSHSQWNLPLGLYQTFLLSRQTWSPKFLWCFFYFSSKVISHSILHCTRALSQLWLNFLNLSFVCVDCWDTLLEQQNPTVCEALPVVFHELWHHNGKIIIFEVHKFGWGVLPSGFGVTVWSPGCTFWFLCLLSLNVHWSQSNMLIRGAVWYKNLFLVLFWSEEEKFFPNPTWWSLVCGMVCILVLASGARWLAVIVSLHGKNEPSMSVYSTESVSYCTYPQMVMWDHIVADVGP